MAYWGEIEITENWADLINAITNVTVNYYACSDSYVGWSNYTTYPFCGIYFGSEQVEETKTLTSFDFRKSKKILLGSITTNIPHEADGSRTITTSFSWNTNNNIIGTITGSKSQELSIIPRASKITATDSDIGSGSIIVINKTSEFFTHTVSWEFSGLSGTIAEKTSQTTLGWTIPTSIYQKIPESQSATITITCKTYNGDTLIGTSTTTMKASAITDDSYPTIDTANVIDTNAKTIGLTGSNKRLVKYCSNVKINVSGKCKNYAPLNILTANKINMTTSQSSSNGVTNITGETTFPTSVAEEYNIFLGDKRGLFSQRKLNQGNGDFVLIPYIPLTFNIKPERKSQTSSIIQVSFSGKFFNGYFDASNNKFNAVAIKWRYKEKNGNWITTGADDTTNGWHNLTRNTDYKYGSGNTFYSGTGSDEVAIELADVFDYSKAYTIEFNISDQLSTILIEKDISKSTPCIEWGEMSDGKNYFKVNGNLYDEEGQIKPIDETEWTDLELNTDWRNLGGNYYNAQYKKVNNQIYLRGLIKNSNNNTNKTVLTLPEGIRPQKIPYLMFNMSDTFVSAYITTGGEISLAQYTQNNWVSIEANFFID